MATAGTPRYQLLLQPAGPQEQVLRVTSAHEVVEARHGGVALVFCRKRKEPPAPSPAGPAAPAPSTHTRRASLYRTPAAVRAMTAITGGAVESPYADEVELPQRLGQRLLEGLQALPERAAPADRLLAFCASLGAAAAEVMTGSKAAVLSDALAAFQRSLAGALADGSVALAAAPRPQATPAEEGEVEQQAAPGYQVDLAARKAGLRARLANFQKEEEEWHALLHKVEQLDQQQLVAAAGEEQVAAAGSSAAGGAPAAAASEAETGLSSVATEAGVYGPEAAEQQQPGAAPAPADGGDPAEAEPDAALAVLERLHAGVHRHLAMQVEGVCKLVGDVEELVERAGRAAAAVQAEYHAEKFRAFPHVNSPARLIRELVRAPGPAAKPAAAPASGKAARAAAAADGKENADGMDVV